VSDSGSRASGHHQRMYTRQRMYVCMLYVCIKECILYITEAATHPEGCDRIIICVTAD
jgi:hypothetical protein